MGGRRSLAAPGSRVKANEVYIRRVIKPALGHPLMLAMPARGQVHGEVTAAVPGGEVTRERIHAKPRLSVTIYLLAQA